MRYLLLLLALLTGLPSFAARTRTYPNIHTVVDELYKRQQVPFSNSSQRIHFAKKKQGWMLQIVDETHRPWTVLNEQLFWDVATGNFLRIPGWPEGPTPKAKEQIDYFFLDCGVYNYERSPYYGYNGWDADAIRDFGKVTRLSDTLLEGLARAYATAAYSFTDSRMFYCRPVGILTEQSRRDSFIFYSRLNIQTYDRLRKQNRDYLMLVGNAMTKYSDEVMAFYDQLVLYHMEPLAAEYFREELYDPQLLSFAQYMLTACEKDAILFSNGDNDTYPLEYLQHKGLRTDVTVINTSLLNLKEYVALYASGKQYAKPVRFSLPFAIYRDDESELFFSDHSASPTHTPVTFLSSVRVADTGGFVFTPGKISFASHSERFPGYEKDCSFAENATMNVTAGWLTRSTMAQYDIIFSNLGERPVYYLNTVGSIEEPIQHYLFDEGWVMRFIPAEALHTLPATMSGYNYIPGKMYRNLRAFPKSAAGKPDRQTVGSFVYNLRFEVAQLATTLENSDPLSAITVLQHCDSVFPTREWQQDLPGIYLFTASYHCHAYAAGDVIANSVMDMIEEKMKKGLAADERQTWSAYRYVLDMICLESTIANRSKIANRALQLRNKYFLPQ